MEPLAIKKACAISIENSIAGNVSFFNKHEYYQKGLFVEIEQIKDWCITVHSVSLLYGTIFRT